MNKMLYTKKTIDIGSDPNWYKFEDSTTYDYSKYKTSWEHNIFPKEVSIPENGLYKIPMGIVFFDGMSLTCDKQVLADLHWIHSPFWTSPFAEQSFYQKITNLNFKKGRCLNLCTYFSDRNYFHCILGSFCKFEIVENSSPIKLEDFDYILLPKSKFKNAELLIKYFKIPYDKILWADINIQYQFEELYTPSHRGAPMITRVGSLNKIKSAFNLENNTPTRKLYICRNGYSKNIKNESEVWKTLKNLGFEKIDSAKEEFSCRLFNEASIVVGASGSGLTEIFACQPKTKILELSSLFLQQHYFMSLAHAASLDYSSMFCGSDIDFKVASLSNYDQLFCGTRKDFYVDIVKLKKILDDML
jgi:hypothetical protein